MLVTFKLIWRNQDGKYHHQVQQEGLEVNIHVQLLARGYSPAQS